MTLRCLDAPKRVTLIGNHFQPRARWVAVDDTEPLVPATATGPDLISVLVQYEAVVGDPDTFGKVDHVTCRERWSVVRDGHRPGVCGAVVPVPPDGALPDRCPYGHRLPWHGTLEPTAGPVR